MKPTEKFKVNKGSRIEIVDALTNEFSLSACEAEAVVSFLIENKEILSEDEVILTDTHVDGQAGAAEFITDSMTYYINVRRFTVHFVLFLLNIKDGINLKTLIECGINIGLDPQLFVNLTKERGSKCLVMELAKHGKKGMSLKEILNWYGVNSGGNRECFNNHYDHCYNTDGYCEIQKERISNILDFLEEGGIVKVRLGRYYYRA